MKHKIVICMGSSCFARGNEKNVQIIQDFLSNLQLEADVEFTGTHCTNQCALGPNISIDGEMFHQIESSSLNELLKQKLTNPQTNSELNP